MANDSRSANILRPTGSENEANFLDPLRGWVAELVNFPRESVRASWLPQPGTQPPVSSNWCALAIKGAETTPIYREGRKGRLADPVSGDIRQISHDDYQIVVSFYGPAAMFNAQRFRDGAQLSQNRRALERSGLTLMHLDHRTLRLPDFAGEHWIDRYDIEFHVGRKISRTYGVRTLVSADVDFYTERGKL